ncbi:MAG: HPr(Ser) kinase/phosphatase [Lachnospiraceae bacterium]|nr:HPr(Ser) kinase/phosphatase [Lachnospiraceae bacterium]
MYTTSVKDLADKFDLKNCTPDLDISKRKISHSEINRPALQLAGFYDYFDNVRVQIIGNVENAYMNQFDEDTRISVIEKLMSFNPPCLVFCQGINPSERLSELATKMGVPVLSTEKGTCNFESEAIRWLKVELAPRITIHGVLVDVYGEGVLITGESGIGKSEAALELIKRGHRLVADDAVEIKKVSDDTLVGSAPAVTQHMIELRGIGIINVKALFGVESVKNTQNIDLVINLEEWNKDKEYDRMGLEEHFTEYLGNKITCHNIPIRPGRNLAIICESAAVNHRSKKMGYNAATEFYDRVMENMKRAKEEDEE